MLIKGKEERDVNKFNQQKSKKGVGKKRNDVKKMKTK
jgi:hypothetical protein